MGQHYCLFLNYSILVHSERGGRCLWLCCTYHASVGSSNPKAKLMLLVKFKEMQQNKRHAFLIEISSEEGMGG